MSNKKPNHLFDRFYEVISNRKNIFFFLVFTLPLLFQKYFEALFNEYITNPIFLNLESNKYVDILAIIFVFILAIYYYHKFKKGYVLSSFKSCIIFIFTFWYIIYRIKGGWHYQSFSFCSFLFYSDIFLIIPIAYISFLCINRSPNSLIIKTNEGFLVDQSINSPEEDTLGRKEYAKAIANKIEKSFPSDALAIAITGKWGSGKTSFIQLIENNLTQQPIIINFNSRKNHDSNNIIIDFFDELEATLGIYNENLSFSIHQYLKQLTTVDDNIYFKTIDFLTNTIFGKKSTQDMFNDIDKTIQNIGRQVVIFIDDIDRLDSKEIIEVIKLIRFSANFKNAVFLVAFDKSYVINAINEFNTYEKEWFLEKIFQVEFPLPTFEKNRIQNELIKKLKTQIGEPYHQEIDNYFSKGNNLDIFRGCILTLRDVSRFTNAFAINFLQVAEEVLFKDFFNMELIKLKYFSIYELLFSDPDLFLSDRNEVNIRKNHFLLLNKEVFEKNIKDLNISDREIIKIKEYVAKIFQPPQIFIETSKQELVNTENNKSIRRPSNFMIYSSIRLTEGVLGEKQFKNARQADLEVFKKAIDKWIEDGLFAELQLRFEIIKYYDNDDDFYKIIHALLYFGSKSKLFTLKYRNFDFPINIINKIQDRYQEIKNKNLIIKNFKEAILEIIDNGEYDIEFKLVLLKVCNSDYQTNLKARNFFFSENIHFFLLKEEIHNLLYKYFVKYVERYKQFSKEFWEVYFFCSYYEENNTKAVPTINAFIKEFAIKNDIKGFFEFIIQKNNSEKGYALIEHVHTIFPEKNSLFEFINSLEESTLKIKLLEFYTHLKQNNFWFTSFDFDGELDI